MKIFLTIVALATLITIYAAILRPLMRKTAWGQPFLDWIEPMERALWLKSETILRARSKVFFGLLLTALTWLGAIDVNDILPLVPDAYDSYVTIAFKLVPLLVSLSGGVDEWMRRDTTKALETVSMRTDAPIEVKVAVAKAEEAMAEAVAEVKTSEAA